jgi:hypothetical protein
VIVSVDTGSLVWPGSAKVTGTAVPAFSAGETRRPPPFDLARRTLSEVRRAPAERR